MRVTVPSSTWGSSASCWALLKRWISSRNRTVRSAVEGEPVLGLGDGRAHLDDARHHRRQRDEVRADGVREEPREAGLAGARRAPQQDRRQVPAGDAAAERPALADEVGLPDELLEVARAHARGERLSLGRWLEERLGTGAPGPGSRRGHARMVRRPTGAAGSDRAGAHRVGDDPEDDHDQDQRAADEGDPLDVATDVGVLLGRADREARRRPRARTRRSPGALRGRCRACGHPRRTAPRRRSGLRARRHGAPLRRSGSRAGEPVRRRSRRRARRRCVGRRWSGAR